MHLINPYMAVLEQLLHTRKLEPSVNPKWCSEPVLLTLAGSTVVYCEMKHKTDL